MGRTRNPIEDKTPVARFAQMLRDRIDRADKTYREIATTSIYGYSSIARAAGGKTLPTWKLTQAILVGCATDTKQMAWWREQWENAKRLNSDPGQADAGDEDDDLRWGLASPPVRGYREWRPQPEIVQTFDDLVFELKRFRIAAGNPSLRQLEAEMRRFSLGKPCSTTLLSELFRGKRHPKMEVFRALISALFLRMHMFHGHNERGRPWTTDAAWFDAWARAEFDREEPGRPPEQDSMPSFTAEPAAGGSDVQALALKSPRLAAKFFADMDPGTAARLISAMPPETWVELLAEVFVEQRKQPNTTRWETGSSSPERVVP